MTMANTLRSRRDRWADWLVIGVVIVALLLGWATKSWAEGSTEQFTDSQTGLVLDYPAGWLAGSGEDYIFQARDPQSGPFKITYRATAEKLDPARPLSLVDSVNLSSVNRARKLTAFQVLDIETVGQDEGSPKSVWARYVYVEEKPDPFRESLPVVVMGLDYTAVKGDYLYTFSLLAGEADFDGAEKGFKDFLQDAGFDL